MTWQAVKSGVLILSCVLVLGLTGCTQESQNQLGRSIQNWTGTDGVLDVFAGEKIAMRIIKIDKLTTAQGTDVSLPRAYRFGYGYVDENFNFRVDNGEKKIYFEISDYSTNYIFYENYKG
jgi:hypothetical protein